MAFANVPNRTAIAQQFQAIPLRTAAAKANPSSAGASSGRSGKGKATGGNCPKCTHPTCDKKLGHTTEKCFTRKREQRAAKKACKRNKSTRDGKGGGKRPKKSSATPPANSASDSDSD